MIKGMKKKYKNFIKNDTNIVAIGIFLLIILYYMLIQ